MIFIKVYIWECLRHIQSKPNCSSADKIVADNILNIFIIFIEKIRLDISCEADDC